MSSLLLGVRWMIRRPLAALASCTCLAVGMASAAVAWTLLDAGVMRPFGLQNTEPLLIVWESNPARNQPLIEVSLLNFQDWQRQARTIESMAAFGSQHWPGLARIGGESIPLALRGVSTSFFPTLGVTPLQGRNFVPSDAKADVAPPIVLSHRLWQSRFGGRAVVGQPLFVDGTEYTIIGIMARGFAYPDDPDAWVNVERVLGDAFRETPIDQQRQIGVLEVLARRAGTASTADVQSELTAIVQSLQRRHSPAAAEVTTVASVASFRDSVLGQLGARVWIAVAMSLAVFVLACANVAAVRAAQLRERSHEIAARGFMGATRLRLLNELATEPVTLVLIAGVLAAAMAAGFVRLLSASTTISDSGIDLSGQLATTLIWILGLTVLGWALSSLWPAAFASRHTLADAAQSHQRTTARVSRVGVPLLFGQAATAIIVVAVAAIALATFARLSRIDMGFATAGVTFIDLALPDWKYKSPADARLVIERLQTELRGIAGARDVAAVSVRPFRFGEIVDGQPVRRSGDALVQPDDATGASRVVVTPDYFSALGLPVVAGRGFSTADRADGERVAIISRTLATVLFGDIDAVGRSIETFSLSEKWRARRIVGVVGDARYRGLEHPSMEVYVPHTQVGTPLGSLVLSTRAPLTAHDLRRAFDRVDPDVAIERVQTTSDVRQSVLSPARLLASIVSLLAGTGLLLLTMGIFGATATALRAAWGEIAVRQAVGALPVQAARAPLRPLARALVVGIIFGVALTPLAFSAARAVGLDDGAGAVAVAVAAVLVPVVALAASAPSLWRASRVPPADLLRGR